MRKTFSVLLLLVFFLSFYSFCSLEQAGALQPKFRPSYLFFDKDNNSTVNVASNKIFKLSLDSNPTTGYDWSIFGLDKKAFKVVDSGFQAPNIKLVGAGGVRWWKIKVLKEGKHNLELLYYRPWEGRDKSVKKYTLQILVK
ncbi:MAG: protease inhibitor I42 family protein [Candidatus Saganbacteria bacterium]|nr:protease inhibitor I42 family protein [Candidatus Saganbacteria bacterium]